VTECREADCTRRAESRGWCDMHYNRRRRAGDIKGIQQVPKSYGGQGKLRCDICGEPLLTHSVLRPCLL